MTFAAAALVIVLGGAEAGAVPDRGQTPAAQRAAEAAKTVLDRRYQRELPLIPAEGTTKKPRDIAKDGTPQTPEGRQKTIRARESRQGTSTVLGGIMQAIALAVVGVGVGMLVLWILRDLRRGSGNDALEGNEVTEATVDLDVVQRPVGDADELAREGRYAEAIHTLLLRTLVELVRATRTRVPAALTSREILARVPLVPPARTALDALVSAVEITHFGDEVPGAADYQRCREEFQRFADAYRGAA